MPLLYFSKLPPGVPPAAFRDAIQKILHEVTENRLDGAGFIIHFGLSEEKGDNIQRTSGVGYVNFRNEFLLEALLAKLKTEPLMFERRTVLFTRNPPVSTQSFSVTGSSVQSRQDDTPPKSQTVTATASTNLHKQTMNLHKPKYIPQPKKYPPRENPIQERRLHHRLSALGQPKRIIGIEFGILRGQTFSREYPRKYPESGGYFTFEDDEKSVRISMGGTHSDPAMPSIAISIQTINRVMLGYDTGVPYMFLDLLHNPRFELGTTAQTTTGNARADSHNCRTRHSALNPEHRRVAAFTSHWLKILFYDDTNCPKIEDCLEAGLPPPDTRSQLNFEAFDFYSSRNISKLEKWLQGGYLPWEVAFQCEALFKNGTLVPEELLSLRSSVESLTRDSPARASDALISFREEFEGPKGREIFKRFNPQVVVSAFKEHVEIANRAAAAGESYGRTQKSNFVCHHIKITPTAVIYGGPVEEQSNRVIRRYPGFHSCFIRVGFTDEGAQRSLVEWEVNTHAFSEARVGTFLKNGIRVGDRDYRLLGYSQSGFKNHACFFSSDFKFNGSMITPESIRASLGDFSNIIHYPARYGARMSQAFSSTDPSITLPHSTLKPLEEIQGTKGEVFSDGCGTISRDLAKKVWESQLEQMPESVRKLRHEDEPVPCAFQIRIAGSKGMVRIDPKLEGEQFCLRPSMTKFEAKGEFDLDISRAFAWPSPCYLNRPLVMLLWTAGVESSVFERLIKEALGTIITGMKTFRGAAIQLNTHGLGSSFHLDKTFERLSRLDLELDKPGVRSTGLNKLLNAGLFHIKRGLKQKARIPVLGSYTLVGVCDEEKYLKPREIYACIQEFDNQSGKTKRHYLQGRILVTRSPVIHPGDAQIVWGIGSPPNDSPFGSDDSVISNCVVFSSYGIRPVPNMLGGGDLDGDIYNLITLPELIPPSIDCPASYPQANLKRIDWPSTIDDVADFMVEFICHDSVGLIATNHLTIASIAELRARDPDCLTNARLHSTAVDFIKTGTPVPNEKIKKPKQSLQPDWKIGHGRSAADSKHYECESVLGRLFRSVDLTQPEPVRLALKSETITGKLAAHVARYANDIKYFVKDVKPWVGNLLSRYILELNHICASHTVSNESHERVSEVEVILGTNLETMTGTKDLIQRMKRVTRNLVDVVRSALKGEGTSHEWLARAWVAYLHTSNLGDATFGAFSFSWIALGSVLDALCVLDESFLPHLGPLESLIPTTLASTTSKDQADPSVPTIDLHCWEWEVDPRSEKAGGNNATQASRPGFGKNQDGPRCKTNNQPPPRRHGYQFVR